MRWQIVLSISLALLAIMLDQTPVVGQCIPGVARACGGCGPFRMRPRQMCRPMLRPNCACPAPMPMPMPCAPACNTYVTRMHPRQVVNWEMIPQTVCRQQAYCETVPITTYRQVVVTVPQTEYRNVMRYQTVADQVMVPRRTVSTVWEPRMHRMSVPMIQPQMPVCNSGCTDLGFGGAGMPGMGMTGMGMPGMNMSGMGMQHMTEGEYSVMPQPYSDGMNSGPMMTVPPMTPMYDQLRVPAPMPDPNFTPSNSGDNSQSYYNPYSRPWQTTPAHYAPSYGTAFDSGYRTLGNIQQTSGVAPNPWNTPY